MRMTLIAGGMHRVDFWLAVERVVRSLDRIIGGAADPNHSRRQRPMRGTIG
jgi:hypothetical protein